MEVSMWMWIGFGVVVTAALYVDLGLLNRHAHEVSLKEAGFWCGVWASLSMLFCVWIYYQLGTAKAMEFLTGYIIEYTLSIDNMFVFIVVFEYFNVPRIHQPRILHWGILGAVFMRLILIFAGVALIQAFHWVIYVFGAVLIFTGVKLAVEKDQKIEPDKNPVLKLFKRMMPFADRYSGESFFIKENGRTHATPLFATLIVIEATDVVFAIDSIPAILAITTDRFIVYTSNIFAIMGLRSLFFLLSGIMGMFRFLKIGISAILCFIGVKMLMVDVYKIPVEASLCVIAVILVVSVAASVLIKEKAAGGDSH